VAGGYDTTSPRRQGDGIFAHQNNFWHILEGQIIENFGIYLAI
jgi:hypothetical protein